MKLLLVVFLLVGHGWVASAQTFVRLSADDCGVTFTNPVTETDSFNILTDFYAYNGGGVGVGDYDGDGLLDLYFSSTQLRDRLYRNLGELRFEEVTENVGITYDPTTVSTGVLFTDVTGDGHDDLVVCRRYGHVLFFVNTGKGAFEERSQQSGLIVPRNATMAAPIDYDRDGDLDLFVVVNGEPRRKGYLNKGEPDQLFRNNGDGTFTNVTTQAQLKDIGYGLSVGIADLNDDGWPDMFVANDFEEPDDLWLNRGDGTFRNAAKESLQNMSWASMGSEIVDLNRDGWLDILSVDMLPRDHRRRMTQLGNMSIYGPYFDSTQRINNAVHLGMGNGRYVNVCHLAGLAATDWSWSVLGADFDHDAQMDVFITNGVKRDVGDQDYNYDLFNPQKAFTSDVYLQMPRSWLPNFYFAGTGRLAMEEASARVGLTDSLISNGAAYADLDEDGDLDLILNNTDTVAVIYENRTNQQPQHGHWLQVSLRGRVPNHKGIGSRLWCHTPGGVFVREAQPARGYQSSVDPRIHIGLGSIQRVDSIVVRWSDGTVTRVRTPKIDRLIEIRQEGREQWKAPSRSDAMFTELPKRTIPFMHRENRYDDFKRERLLPYRLSTWGPGMAVGDVTGDGLDDVVMTGAKYAFTQLFVQQPDGTFVLSAASGLSDTDESEDVDVALFDADGDGDLDCYVVTGGSEFDFEDIELADRLYLNDGKGLFTRSSDVPTFTSSGTCVRPADVDADGDMDLFVGGRVIPGFFPLAERSRLLTNTKGEFTVAAELDAGMVTDAVWTDADGDGDKDLFVVGEWMAPTLYSNNGGTLTAVPMADSLALSGIWSAVIAADIDGDGDEDVLAGNIGLNCRYVPDVSTPIVLTAGDFDENGSIDPVITYTPQSDTTIQLPTRDRMAMIQHMPVATRTFNTYAQYANATLSELIPSDKRDTARTYSVSTYASGVFRNNGRGAYTFEPFPELAQVAPVYGLHAMDVDADGDLDVLVVGNNRSADPDQVALDSGIGTVLINDGKGAFSAMLTSTTGFSIPGQARTIHTVRTASGETLICVAMNSDLPMVFRFNGGR